MTTQVKPGCVISDSYQIIAWVSSEAGAGRATTGCEARTLGGKLYARKEC